MNHPNTTHDSDKIQCDICKGTYRLRGFANHRRVCDAKRIKMMLLQDHTDKVEKAKAMNVATRRAGTSLGPSRTVVKPWENVGRLYEKPKAPAHHHINQQGAGPAAPCCNPTPQPIPDADEEIQPDTIRAEYHPHSNLPPNINREYHSQRQPPTPQNPNNQRTPFRTRADFEFAEIALDAALNKRQVNALLNLFHRCIEGEDKLELKDHADLTEIWDSTCGSHESIVRSLRRECHLRFYSTTVRVGSATSERPDPGVPSSVGWPRTAIGSGYE